MNRNEKEFIHKYPGKRQKMRKLLIRELKLLKKIGFPEGHISNMAGAFTKHIINILMEDI